MRLSIGDLNPSRAKFWLISWSNRLLIDFFDPNLKPDCNSSRRGKNVYFCRKYVEMIEIYPKRWIMIEKDKINFFDINWLFWSFNLLFLSFNWLFFNPKEIENDWFESKIDQNSIEILIDDQIWTAWNPNGRFVGPHHWILIEVG